MISRMMRLLVPLAIAAVAACGPSKPSGPQQPVDVDAPEFEGGGQEGEIGDPVYPGPYGTGIGSVIPNYTFMGFPRWETGPTEMVKMSLADFYNPTGTDVYPEGSPYGEGNPKPKALLIDRSAVWCGPCNFEAAETLPAALDEYEARGGEVLLLLGEGPSGGKPATQYDLEKWSKKYNLNYPGSIDPNGTISAVVGVDAWPGNVIVRTSDMKIVEWSAGAPEFNPNNKAAFWLTYEDVLDGKPVLPTDK